MVGNGTSLLTVGLLRLTVGRTNNDGEEISLAVLKLNLNNNILKSLVLFTFVCSVSMYESVKCTPELSLEAS